MFDCLTRLKLQIISCSVGSIFSIDRFLCILKRFHGDVGMALLWCKWQVILCNIFINAVFVFPSCTFDGEANERSDFWVWLKWRVETAWDALLEACQETTEANNFVLPDLCPLQNFWTWSHLHLSFFFFLFPLEHHHSQQSLYKSFYNYSHHCLSIR